MSGRVDFLKFLDTAELAELGPGPREGVETADSLRQQLKPLFAGSHLSVQRQELIRALILLWHDHLDAAHTIAQSVESPDGAFVHGIMHRREPDFGNAAYWFRRVGRHSAFPMIVSGCDALSSSADAAKSAVRLVREGNWDPFAFIDACESASRGSEDTQQLLRRIQQVEFKALLEHLTAPAR